MPHESPVVLVPLHVLAALMRSDQMEWFARHQIFLLRRSEAGPVIEDHEGRSYKADGVLADDYVDDDGNRIRGKTPAGYDFRVSEDRNSLTHYLSWGRAVRILVPKLKDRAAEAMGRARALLQVMAETAERPAAEWVSDRDFSAYPAGDYPYPLGTRLIHVQGDASGGWDYGRHHLRGPAWQWTEDDIAKARETNSAVVVGFAELGEYRDGTCLLVERPDGSREWLWWHNLQGRVSRWATEADIRASVAEAKATRRAELEKERARIDSSLAALS